VLRDRRPGRSRTDVAGGRRPEAPDNDIVFISHGHPDSANPKAAARVGRARPEPV